MKSRVTGAGRGSADPPRVRHGGALLGLALLGLGVARPAPAAEMLTLAGAAETALRRNPAVAAGRAGETAAQAARREARLARLPGVELSETGVRTTSPADVFGLQLMQERFSFPAFTSRDPNRPEALDNFTTRVQATLPLFTGGQLSGGIAQASHMAAAAGAFREHTELAVQLGVAEAYLGALLADRFVELATRARATTFKHVEQAQDFFAAGMLVESDLLTARVQLATMDEALIRARNGARLARAGLNQAMGVAQDLDFELEPPAPADSMTVTEAEALELARGGRRDRRGVENQVEAAHRGVGRARGEYWPQLGLSASYAWNDDRPFGTHGESYTVAALLQWKVWNWGQTRARVQRSESEYSAARAGQSAFEQQLEFDVRRARQAVDEARARVAVTAGAVSAAERALAIVEDRFGQGIARTTDLLDAETRAHEARVRDAQARFDLEKANRTLRFTVGLPPIPEVES